ncbi:MAG: ATP-binding cassette domain-containing protein [Chloroflexi bacterium]|nr:ATP-binding cassette domain-containing protein [Chloroflexota bacterium]
MAQVTLTHVVKEFSPGIPPAVDHLDLSISDGEFLVLLGPSGCGKTTTLRMIAGLEMPTSGEVSIGDRLVTHLPPGDRDIAFVFQFYALYPHLSVRDNISFPLRAQQVPKAEVDKRVSEIAERLRIEHVLKRRPNRLPAGEQQRVALGRAIVRQPQVFLMDEPLTNLDAALRADMRVELKHLQQELGTTTVYVTHDQIEAMSMSNRIAVMNLGVLQQVGTPLEIYNHPQTLFVATFIGSPPMNTVAGQMGDNGIFVSGDFRLPLGDSSLPAGKNVIFGVRSESMTLVSADSDADLRGEILLREPLGDETIYTVAVGGVTLMAKAPPRQMHQPGETVGLNIDRDRVHLFDAATEQALTRIETLS